MQNNERFQNLPPGRQQQIRQNLQKWNNLTPEEQDAIKRRCRNLQQLSPAAARQCKELNCCRSGRRFDRPRGAAVNGYLHTLQGMSPADREKALNDPKFMQGLNPDEQSMVKSLNTLRSARRGAVTPTSKKFFINSYNTFPAFSLSIEQLGVR